MKLIKIDQEAFCYEKEKRIIPAAGGGAGAGLGLPGVMEPVVNCEGTIPK